MRILCRKGFFCLLATVSFLTIEAKPLKAHAIQSEITLLNGKIELKSIFSTGEPVTGAIVSLLNQDGLPQREVGFINKLGKLILDLPNLNEGNIELKIDGGPGHRDYLLIPIRSGKPNLDEVVSNPTTKNRSWVLSLKRSPLFPVKRDYSLWL